MVAGCVCASAVWLELAVHVTDLLWEKGCSFPRTSGNAGRVAIRIVERRYAHGIGVGNVMCPGADRRRVVGDPVSTGGEQCASCVTPVVFEGVCGKPLWWRAGGMEWFGHGAC